MWICLNCPIMCLYVLSSVLWCPLRFPHKTDVRFVLAGVFMPYLCFFCLLVYSGVQHILCCGFFCLRIVYPMLPVSLDYPCLIAPSVLSYVYLINIVPLLLQRSEHCNMSIVLSVLLRFTAFDYPFGIFKLVFETTSNLTLHYIDN
jgi:hypothetical protein